MRSGPRTPRPPSRPPPTGTRGAAVFHQLSSSNPAPSVPTGLSAPTDTASSVGLSWTASTGGATGYTIYRNGTQIGTSTSPTYTDSTVSPSTTYQYTVDAYNGAGTHSAQSSPALAVTTPAAVPPSVPTGLSAPTDTASSVGLSWTASTGGATGYTIYRNGTQIGTSTTPTYTDSTVSPSTTYQYTVDAYNGAGTGLGPVLTGTGGDHPSRRAPERPDRVERPHRHGEFGRAQLDRLDRGSDRLHDLPQRDPDRDLDHSYLHRLDGQPLDHLPVHGGRLQRGRHDSAQSSPALAVTTPAAVPPSVPTGLSAPTDTASSVGLSWTASTGGATGYTIYRNGTQIGPRPVLPTPTRRSAPRPPTSTRWTPTTGPALTRPSPHRHWR